MRILLAGISALLLMAFTAISTFAQTPGPSVDLSGAISTTATGLADTSTGLPAYVFAAIGILIGLLALRFGLRLVRQFVR